MNTTHRFRPETSESTVIRIFSGIQNSLATLRQIEKLIEQYKPDAIHLSSSASLALIKDALIMRKAHQKNIKVILHWHFGRIPELKMKQNREWKLLLKLIHKSALSIVIDPRSFQILKEEGLTNIAYVPNALPAGITPQTGKSYQEGEAGDRHGRVIFVGHVIRSKGVFELVHACSGIEYVKELIIVGKYETAVKKKLEKIALVHAFGNRIKFTGEINKQEVLKCMATSGLLVLPSYTEGFPMVILEAMAMGCAIVASHVGAIPEMLAINSNNPCGICVPPQNVDILKSTITELMRNPAKLDEYGNRGVELVFENYSMPAVFGLYKSVWERAVTPN